MNRKEICAKVGDMITGERNATHGDPFEQFNIGQAIKNAAGYRDSQFLTDVEREALDMICTNISRLAAGTPILDHWLDIIGYAAIAAEERDRQLSSAAKKPTPVVFPDKAAIMALEYVKTAAKPITYRSIRDHLNRDGVSFETASKAIDYLFNTGQLYYTNGAEGHVDYTK